MSSTAIATITKMLESLPEPAQDQVVEHLREYLEDLQDELQWDALFKRTQAQLVAAARRAEQEIAQGLAKPMDYDQFEGDTVTWFWIGRHDSYERFFS
jgi:hypothetical protein